MSAPAASGGKVSRASAGRYVVAGEATMRTVGALRAAGRLAFAAESGPVVVDLAGITRVDSAGLAMLIDWLAWARAAQRALRFESIPAALSALARLSDVADLLGDAPAGAPAAPPPAPVASRPPH